MNKKSNLHFSKKAFHQLPIHPSNCLSLINSDGCIDEEDSEDLL